LNVTLKIFYRQACNYCGELPRGAAEAMPRGPEAHTATFIAKRWV